MYTYDKKVLFSDIDSSAKMSVYSVLNAMQDCVNVNSESIGRGIDYMLEKQRSWFAISWNIEIKRYPKMFEDVVVKTWPYDFSQTMGFRNVVITDANGEDILCADSIWALMDIKNMRPTKILEEDRMGYDLEPKYPMEERPRKIVLPKVFEEVERVKVKKTQVDYNGHMSNGEYIRMADECLNAGQSPSNIRVEYKQQSKQGEELLIECATEDNRVVVRFTGVENADVKSVVEFTM